jgi:hypothetical protein
MARFEPLTSYLRQLDSDAVILTFDEVESLAGARLPRSARKTGSSFWSNTERNIYARHWLVAGFEAGFEGCDENEVCFTRLVEGEETDTGTVTDPRLAVPPPPNAPPAAPPPPEPHADLPPPPPPVSSLPPPPTEVTRAADAARLGQAVSETFVLGDAVLVERLGAPASGWDHVPEAELASRLRAGAVDDVWVRLVLTFGAVIDRGRGRPAVWAAVGALWSASHDLFDPAAVSAHGLRPLGAAMRTAGLPARLPDVAAWHLLAETLADEAVTPGLVTTIYAGLGDARALVAELAGGGDPPVPALAGRRAARRWIRSLVHPGAATIGGVAELGVVVDGDVRRATELLGLSPPASSGMALSDDEIEALWGEACRTSPPAGPPGLTGTPLALDQALAYHGRVGCRWCRDHTRVEPIGPACESCILVAAVRST